MIAALTEMPVLAEWDAGYRVWLKRALRQRGFSVAEERIMPAADVARAFWDVYRLGRNTVVEEIVLRPQRGDL